MQEFPECPLWENCVRVVLAMTHAEVEHIMGQTNQTVDSLDNMELAPVSNFIGKYVLEDLVEEYGLNKSALTYIAERKRSFERTPPRRARDRSPNRGFDKLTIARRTEVETHAGTSRRTSTTAPRSRRNSRTRGPRRAYGAARKRRDGSRRRRGRDVDRPRTDASSARRSTPPPSAAA